MIYTKASTHEITSQRQNKQLCKIWNKAAPAKWLEIIKRTV